jgi:hypothetical protein
MMEAATEISGQRALDTARLRLEGVDTTVVTRVKHRGLYRMTVAQTLPFLRLSAAVEDDAGRAAHIESVTVDFEGDTPSLVLELVYDDDDETEASPGPDARPSGVRLTKARRDPTVPYEIPKARARRDPTVSYVTERAKRGAEIVLTEREAALALSAAPTFWHRVLGLFGRIGTSLVSLVS